MKKKKTLNNVEKVLFWMKIKNTKKNFSLFQNSKNIFANIFVSVLIGRKIGEEKSRVSAYHFFPSALTQNIKN